MKQLTQRLVDQQKLCGYEFPKQYSHYHLGYKKSTAPQVRRTFAQLEFALSMAQEDEACPREPIERAMGCLEAGVARDGAVAWQTAREVEAALEPLGARAKRYRVHMVGHAHIDMNWLWPWRETVSVTLETFRTVLRLMEEFPEFTFSQSQASCYAIVEQYEPEMLAQIRRRIREGRWEVAAATWVEGDKNMPSAESMSRHLLYARRYLKALLGVEEQPLDFEPDTFGHAASVPEILSSGGVRWYYHCRGYDGHAAYRWQAPSGAEILAYREPSWYLGDISHHFANHVPAFCRQYNVNEAMKVYGVGDHGGGPTRRDLRLIQEMQRWPVFPQLVFSNYQSFYRSLEQVREQLPVVRGELNSVFTGCYTTQTQIKQVNRMGEYALGCAEMAASAASALARRSYSAERFERAWRHVLFNQFHDILPGSGIRETRQLAVAQGDQALAVAGTEYASSVRAIAAHMDTSAFDGGEDRDDRAEGAGVGAHKGGICQAEASRGGGSNRVLALCNPSGADWSGPVEVTIWDWEGDERRAFIRDACGNELPMQWLDAEPRMSSWHAYRRLLVDAGVPAFGWKCVALEEREADRLPLPLASDPRLHRPETFELENERIRARFNGQSGRLESLLDKQTGRVMAGGGFVLIEEDTDKGMTSWIVGRYMRKTPLEGARIRRGAWGDLRQSLDLIYAFGDNGSTLTATVSLDRGGDTLVYRVVCDWRELGRKETRVLQLAYEGQLADAFENVRCVEPGGIIERRKQAQDMPSHGVIAALPLHGGRTVVLSADCKYGMRAEEDRLHVTLIRSAFEPDPMPDQGKNEFAIGLSVVDAQDIQRQMALSDGLMQPVTAHPVEVHAGDLPAEGRFVHVKGARLMALKGAEDGDGLIVRLSNPLDSVQTAVVAFRRPVVRACLTDVHERNGKPVELPDHAVQLALRPHAIASVRVNLEEV